MARNIFYFLCRIWRDKKVKCAAAKLVVFAFVRSAFIPPHTAICFAASFQYPMFPIS